MIEMYALTVNWFQYSLVQISTESPKYFIFLPISTYDLVNEIKSSGITLSFQECLVV